MISTDTNPSAYEPVLKFLLFLLAHAQCVLFPCMTNDFWQCVGHYISKTICKNNLRLSMIAFFFQRGFSFASARYLMSYQSGSISNQVLGWGSRAHPDNIQAEGNSVQRLVYSWFTLPEAATLWDPSLKWRQFIRISTLGMLQVSRFSPWPQKFVKSAAQFCSYFFRTCKYFERKIRFEYQSCSPSSFLLDVGFKLLTILSTFWCF